MATLADLFKTCYLTSGNGVEFADIRLHYRGVDEICRAFGASSLTIGSDIYFRRKGELRLGLGPAGPYHGDRVAAALDQRPEQSRLADPGLAVHHQGAALTAHQRGEESVEPGQFGHPADDHLQAPRGGTGNAGSPPRLPGYPTLRV